MDSRDLKIKRCHVVATVELMHLECIVELLWGDFSTRQSGMVRVPIETAMVASQASAGLDGVHNRTTRALALVGEKLLAEQSSGKKILSYDEWLRYMALAFLEVGRSQTIVALRD